MIYQNKVSFGAFSEMVDFIQNIPRHHPHHQHHSQPQPPDLFGPRPPRQPQPCPLQPSSTPTTYTLSSCSVHNHTSALSRLTWPCSRFVTHYRQSAEYFSSRLSHNNISAKRFWIIMNFMCQEQCVGKLMNIHVHPETFRLIYTCIMISCVLKKLLDFCFWNMYLSSWWWNVDTCCIISTVVCAFSTDCMEFMLILVMSTTCRLAELHIFHLVVSVVDWGRIFVGIAALQTATPAAVAAYKVAIVTVTAIIAAAAADSIIQECAYFEFVCLHPCQTLAPARNHYNEPSLNMKHLFHHL